MKDITNTSARIALAVASSCRNEAPLANAARIPLLARCRVRELASIIAVLIIILKPARARLDDVASETHLLSIDDAGAITRSS